MRMAIAIRMSCIGKNRFYPLGWLGIALLVLLAACGQEEQQADGSVFGAGLEEGVPLTAPDGPAMQEDPNPATWVPSRFADAWYLPGMDRWDATRWGAPADSAAFNHCMADLDGDGMIDHALFLCRTDSIHPDSAYAVFVAFGDGRDTMLGAFSWAEAMGHIGMGLQLEPPGELRHLGSNEGTEIASPVVLQRPALTLLVFEKSAITWFWKEGRAVRVWTGD